MKRNVNGLIVLVMVLLMFTGTAFSQQQFEVLFSCNMGVQWLVDNFDPAEPGDKVWVRGSFNGWSTDDEMSQSVLNDSLYEAVVFMNLTPVTDTVAYKYYFEHVNTPGDTSENWESGSDRTFHATGNEPDINGNGIPDIIIPERYFSNIDYGDIFTSPTDVFFETDVRPAHAYLAVFDSITYGGQTVTSIDCVYIASGHTNTTPTMAWVWDLPSLSSPEAKALKMNDDGVDGDMTAGDSVWTITVEMGVGAAKNMVWKYGINGIDNEAGFAQDHSENVNQPPDFRVFKQFGEKDSVYYGFQYDGVWDYDNMTIVGIDDNPFNVPEVYKVFQNYPNPFNPSTKIEYALTRKADVKIEIYNTLGQKVRTLVNRTMEPGVHRVAWDGTNGTGQRLGSGIYIYRFTADDYQETKKMILMK